MVYYLTIRKLFSLFFTIFGLLPSLNFPFFYLIKMDSKKSMNRPTGTEGEKD